MFKHDLGDGAELRILEARHAAEFLHFVDENRAFLGRWLRWGEEITTVAEAETFLRRGVKTYVDDGLPWVGIWRGGKMVGGVLFFPVEARIAALEIKLRGLQMANHRALAGAAAALDARIGEAHGHGRSGERALQGVPLRGARLLPLRRLTFFEGE